MVKIAKKVEITSKLEGSNYCMEVLEVESLAHAHGFYKRAPKKITASSLITGFWEMQSKGKNTLRNWAIQTGDQIGGSVTKQAVDKRLNLALLKVVKTCFEKAITTSRQGKELTKQFSSEKKKVKDLLVSFNRVLIHDSTIQKLPNNLYDEFGGITAKDCPRALLRMQAIYNLTETKWFAFSPDTYRENDQSRAGFGLEHLAPRDLLIRDLGYFALDILEQLIEKQYIITSLHPNVHIFTEQGDRIDLLALLRKEKRLDRTVLVGSTKKLPMRLVAQKLSKRQKDKRIKDAKKKHSVTKYTKRYYELLGYEIFLTNIEPSVLSIQDIAKLYGLRWYIEIIFKAWKSYFNFSRIFEKHKMNYTRIMISIYMVLIQFIYLSAHIFAYLKKAIEGNGVYLSILKFMDVVNDLLQPILKINEISQLDRLLPHFAIHAVYEKRNSHKNMMLKYQYFNEL